MSTEKTHEKTPNEQEIWDRAVRIYTRQAATARRTGRTSSLKGIARFPMVENAQAEERAGFSDPDLSVHCFIPEYTLEVPPWKPHMRQDPRWQHAQVYESANRPIDAPLLWPVWNRP